ncbi:two pore domain potassium channel family protein [Naumannella sp. ID2617S]|nr:two pore domain potassium channel family protein [Naumannella sp. ID2617S]
MAYATPIIWPERTEPIWNIIAWTTWALFGIDYFTRVYLATNRARYIRTHLLDLAMIALPLLRPLRLLRLISLLSILNRRATTNLRGRVLTYLLGSTTLLGFCAALAVLDAERPTPEANITNLSDALWWTLTTMTTVGYGDHYPITTTGRLVAAALMVGGIAILGTVTATIASWFVERISGTETEIEQLRRELAELKKHNEPD